MSGAARPLELVVLAGSFGVCRLGPESALPSWVDDGEFWTVSRTMDELSLVCEERLIPSGVASERGYACLKLLGPFDFTEVGIVAGVTGALAEQEISVFVISTFDTDYVLVRGNLLPDAIDALREAGYAVHF